MSAFNGWIDTFIEEKGIDTAHNFEFDEAGTFHIVETATVIAWIKKLDPETKSQDQRQFCQDRLLQWRSDALHGVHGQRHGQGNLRSSCLDEKVSSRNANHPKKIITAAQRQKLLCQLYAPRATC